MNLVPERQQDRAAALMKQRGMVRLSDLLQAGITAATVSRMERAGTVVRLARGLYQLADAPLDTHHTLAEAAMLVPKGIVCLESALAFHGLTDRIPYAVWLAIGFQDWQPRITRPAVRTIRFASRMMTCGVEEHRIENVPVRIFSPAKTVVDLFHLNDKAGRLYQNSTPPDITAAAGALRLALRLGKASADDITHYAQVAGPRTWRLLRPFLETFAADA